MKVSVCIGSSCHLKGSRQVIDGLKALSEQSGLADRVELCGAFCMGKCRDGVSVSIGSEIFSVSPETVGEFFDKEIKTRI